MVASVWRLSSAVASFVFLFACSVHAQSPTPPGDDHQVTPLSTDASLRREAEEKYPMRQIGDKIRIQVRNRMVEGRLMQVTPAGIRLESNWVIRRDLNAELQAQLFQDKHDEMVAEYIRTQLELKNATAKAAKKTVANAVTQKVVVESPSSSLIMDSDGNLYDMSKVTKQEPDGLTFETADGLKKVTFDRLPLKVRIAFDYDKKTADAYRVGKIPPTTVPRSVQAKSYMDMTDAELGQAAKRMKEEIERFQGCATGGEEYRQALSAIEIEQQSRKDERKRADDDARLNASWRQKKLDELDGPPPMKLSPPGRDADGEMGKPIGSQELKAHPERYKGKDIQVVGVVQTCAHGMEGDDQIILEGKVVCVFPSRHPDYLEVKNAWVAAKKNKTRIQATVQGYGSGDVTVSKEPDLVNCCHAHVGREL